MRLIGVVAGMGMLLCGGFWSYWSPPTKGVAPLLAGELANRFLVIPEPISMPSSDTALLELIKKRSSSGTLFIDDAAIGRARADGTLLKFVSPHIAIQHLPFLSQKQRTDDRTFIQYDLRTLASRTVGDTIEVALPGMGTQARAVIDQVQAIDGLLRWSGYILDFQGSARFTITHATQDDYAIGNFSTPIGNFSLEAKNGYGWIVNHDTDFFLTHGSDDTLHP